MALTICDLLAFLPLSYAAVRDYQKRIIPDNAVLLLSLCAVVKVVLRQSTWISALTGGLTIGALLLILAVHTDSLGGGDIKLSAAIGSFFGFGTGLLILIVSLLLLLICGKAKKAETLPFAPFALAGVVVIDLIQILIGVMT